MLAKEADLVEGFAPEVAVVTEAGGAKLEERLVLRPTSEATIWSTYARWMQSYRDLPMLYNAVGKRRALEGAATRGCSCAPASSCGRRATPRARD